MKQSKFLLAKFRSIQAPERPYIDACLLVANELSLPLKAEYISQKEGVVRIMAPPSIKAAVLLKKQLFLQSIQKKYPLLKVKDII